MGSLRRQPVTTGTTAAAAASRPKALPQTAVQAVAKTSPDSGVWQQIEQLYSIVESFQTSQESIHKILKDFQHKLDTLEEKYDEIVETGQFSQALKTQRRKKG